MTPVEWLERHYDDWEYGYINHTHSGLVYFHVKRESRGIPSGRGVSTERGMIDIFNPLVAYADDEEDDPPDPRSYMLCVTCANGIEHRCRNCGDRITHMARGLCIPCWEAKKY